MAVGTAYLSARLETIVGESESPIKFDRLAAASAMMGSLAKISLN